MRFTQYLEKYKDIINEPLKDFQIDYLNLKWNSPDEFAYSKLVKIILVCINKLPLYIRVERSEKGNASISIGADNYFLFTVLLFSLFACYFLFFNIHFLALCVVSIFMGCFVCLNQLFQKQNITSKIILIVTLLLFICNFLCNYLLFMLN